MQDIHSYYNELAPAYDASRFGNSYGRFLHRQEHRALTRYLNGVNPAQALDLACGTGRMLEFAATGCDASPGMLEEAKKKHPGKNLIQGDATCLPFPDASFDAVFSLHFFMHLDRATTRQVWQEIHRVLRPGGKFVFDFPSEKRRNFTGGHHRRQWHGSNALSMQFLLEQTPHQWRLRRSRGIAFFPVHRLPVALRPVFVPLDDFFCHTFFKEYASYLLVCLEKQGDK